MNNDQEQTMSPEAQRTAIAEACGWKRIGNGVRCFLFPCGEYVTGKDGILMMSPAEANGAPAPPDYLNDVAARKEAWRTLAHVQKLSFRSQMKKIALREASGDFWIEEAEFDHWPEAFVRAIGKWQPDTQPKGVE